VSVDPAAMIAESMARIRADPQDLAAWSQLFMILAQARDHANIEGLVTARQSMLGDGLGFFYYVMRDLLALRQDQAALEIAERIGAENALLPVALYMRGLAAARLERSDEAVSFIRAAVRQSERPEIRAFTERDKLFNDYAGKHMATEARLLMPAVEVAALETTPEAAPPAITLRGGPAPANGLVLLAACDNGYFARFGEGLVRSVGAASGNRQLVHLHVVGPDAETGQAIEALLAAHPFLRVSTEPGVYRAAYYACSRFLVLRQLLDHYRCPIVPVDIDITVQKPLDPLAAALAGADIGWFEAGKQLPLPTLICDARLTGFTDTPGSRRVLALFERYISGKYAEGEKWSIDQGGLWSISRALGSAIRRVDFGAMLGSNYAGLLIPVDEAKFALRKAADAEEAGRA
jgi:hypothetical protein